MAQLASCIATFGTQIKFGNKYNILNKGHGSSSNDTTPIRDITWTMTPRCAARTDARRFLHMELELVGGVLASGERHIHEAWVRPTGTI